MFEENNHNSLFFPLFFPLEHRRENIFLIILFYWITI